MQFPELSAFKFFFWKRTLIGYPELSKQQFNGEEPDKETAELMTTFYTYWMKGKSINDAFARAQADMRKKYSPYFWAAFVLVE